MIIYRILRNNHMIKSPKLQALYYPTHMNAGNFIIGLIFGYLIFNNANLERLKSRAVAIVSVASYFLLPAIFKHLIQENFIKFSFGTALIGAYLKHHDGIFLSIILLNLVFDKNEGGRCGKLLKLPCVKLIDKLFYPAFFSQLIVTKAFIATTKTLIELNYFNVVG